MAESGDNDLLIKILTKTSFKNELGDEQCHDTELMKNPMWISYMKKATFFPTPSQVRAFINCIEEGFHKKIISYIHCGAGKGRTAFYLTCLVMSITGLHFEEASEKAREIYPNADDDEVADYENFAVDINQT